MELFALRAKWWAVSSAALVLLLTASIVSAAPRVQVRGSSRVTLQAWGPSASITIMGSLRDEVGAPIGSAGLIIAAIDEAGSAVSWRSVQACGARGVRVVGPLAEHVVETDEVGAFCLQASLDAVRANVQAIYGGSALYEPTRSQVAWDPSRDAVSLAFTPRPERIDLDAEHFSVSVKLSAPRDAAVQGLLIRLEADDEKRLDERRTDASGVVQFRLPTGALAGPGIGRLRAQFGGSDKLSASEASATVTRWARVDLTTDERVRGDPERGLSLLVNTRTAHGPATSGAVEAVMGEEIVGASGVREGVAHLEVTFEAPRTSPVEVMVRYVPDAPYLEAGRSAVVQVTPVRSQAWLRYVPLVLGLGIAAWLLNGWRRPKRREVPAPAVSRRAVASVEVVGAAAAHDRWSGSVVDAHDGSAVVDARVRVVVPSFRDLDVMVDVPVDEQGKFSFQVSSSEPQLKLRVEARLHELIERPLPPASELVVAMVSRRRALLERLVRWARRSGRPWDALPEPTPGHVVRVARDRHPRPQVAAWAELVEQRAYGPDDVDGPVEQEVRELEPGGQALR